MSIQPKLNDYESAIANAKVSVTAIWKHLEILEAIADDPTEVKKWSRRFWDELSKCELVP